LAIPFRRRLADTAEAGRLVQRRCRRNPLVPKVGRVPQATDLSGGNHRAAAGEVCEVRGPCPPTLVTPERICRSPAGGDVTDVARLTSRVHRHGTPRTLVGSGLLGASEHPVLELGGVQFQSALRGDDRVQPGIAEVLMADGIEVEVPQLQSIRCRRTPRCSAGRPARRSPDRRPATTAGNRLPSRRASGRQRS
jgi:hypothetical protein